MILLFGGNVSCRISESRPGERWKQRIARGERKKERKEGRKETVSRGKRPAAEGAETDAGADAQTYGHKKALKYLYLRASVKTATTYSPTCAVPSA